MPLLPSGYCDTCHGDYDHPKFGYGVCPDCRGGMDTGRLEELEDENEDLKEQLDNCEKELVQERYEHEKELEKLKPKPGT